MKRGNLVAFSSDLVVLWQGHRMKNPAK